MWNILQKDPPHPAHTHTHTHLLLHLLLLPSEVDSVRADYQCEGGFPWNSIVRQEVVKEEETDSQLQNRKTWWLRYRDSHAVL